MKLGLSLLIAFAVTISAAEPFHWREIWDGAKSDWWEKPIPELRQLARESPLATLILADKLWNEDRAEARNLRQQAADLGVPQAMVWLSDDTLTSASEKLALLTKASELGYHKGQYELAQLVYDHGMRPDYDKTLELLRKSADQGFAEACFDLAKLYSAGIGEPRNAEDKPFPLLKRATHTSDQTISRYAAQELEKRLRLGLGVEIDLLESASLAFRLKMYQQQSEMSRAMELQRDPNAETLKRLDKLFEDGISLGDQKALLELAALHANGVHGKPNRVRACALLTLAQAPEAESKAKELNETERKTLDEDIQWMRRRFRR